MLPVKRKGSWMWQRVFAIKWISHWDVHSKYTLRFFSANCNWEKSEQNNLFSLGMCDAVYNTKVQAPKREFMITAEKAKWKTQSFLSSHAVSYAWKELFYSSSVANEVSHGIINQTFASQIVLCIASFKSTVLSCSWESVYCFYLCKRREIIPLHKNYKIGFNSFLSYSVSLFSVKQNHKNN